MLNYLSRVAPIAVIVLAFGGLFFQHFRTTNLFSLSTEHSVNPGTPSLIEFHSILGDRNDLPAYLKAEKHNPALFAETVNQLLHLPEPELALRLQECCFTAMNQQYDQQNFNKRMMILLAVLFENSSIEPSMNRKGNTQLPTFSSTGLIKSWDTYFVAQGADELVHNRDLKRLLNDITLNIHQLRRSFLEIPSREQAHNDLELLFESKDWRPGTWDQMSETEQHDYEIKLKKRLREQVEQIAE